MTFTWSQWLWTEVNDIDLKSMTLSLSQWLWTWRFLTLIWSRWPWPRTTTLTRDQQPWCEFNAPKLGLIAMNWDKDINNIKDHTHESLNIGIYTRFPDDYTDIQEEVYSINIAAKMILEQEICPSKFKSDGRSRATLNDLDPRTITSRYAVDCIHCLIL